jgi:flagellar biosynthesis/type III secretory pathway protein FliH
VARVIKGGGGGGPGGQKPPRPATRVIVDAGAKKFIERAVFAAKQDAEHILKRAEEERHAILADGKKAAARAREEAMARGASEAFALAASEALAAFRKRAERYGEAADDIRALALEVVKKVLGTEPDLGPKDVDKILQKGMAALRARRRLRVQVSAQRLGELAHERPNLMRALQSEPDLVIEAVDDVGLGFARVVTEIGGALCAEETALDALSGAVNVREQPRQSRAATGITNVGTAPTGMGAFKPSTESIPAEAAVEEIEAEQEGDDDVDAAPARSAPTRPTAARDARTGRTDDVEEIEAEEDDGPTERTGPATPRTVAAAPVPVKVSPHRAATRVVAIDSSPSVSAGAPRSRALPSADSDATLRQTPIMLSSKDASQIDDDLELFTDDAVKPRNRR